MYPRLPSDVVTAIHDVASALLEEVLHLIVSERITKPEDGRLMIEESRAGEGAACDLDTDHQLDLLECHGDVLGFDVLHHTSIIDLRVKIEESTSAVLASLARDEALEAFQALESVLDREDLDLSALSTTNPYGWARHYSESDEESCHVYHYRNVEGTHVDVLELELSSDHSVFLTRSVDIERLSPRELVFDAT